MFLDAFNKKGVCLCLGRPYLSAVFQFRSDVGGVCLDQIGTISAGEAFESDPGSLLCLLNHFVNVGGEVEGLVDGDAKINDGGDIGNWVIEYGKGVRGASSERDRAAFAWGEGELPEGAPGGDRVEGCLYEVGIGMVEFDIVCVGREFDVWEGVEKIINEHEEEDRTDTGALEDARDDGFRV